jgi:hypothetical protein
MTNECQNPKILPAAGKCQMDFRVQNGILKRVQNDILVMPNLFRYLI